MVKTPPCQREGIIGLVAALAMATIEKLQSQRLVGSVSDGGRRSRTR